MKKVILMVAVATALIFAAPVYAGQDEDNHDTISGASASERASMKSAMTGTAYAKHKWSAATNMEVDKYVNERWSKLSKAVRDVVKGHWTSTGAHNPAYYEGSSVTTVSPQAHGLLGHI